jgi:DNA (cytosine-5)-methyltransferase 1
MGGDELDNKEIKPVITPERINKRQNGRRMKENNEQSFTLTAQDRHGVSDGYKVRRLTPKECERLQGFPDDWTRYGKDDELISDTQRYKCCGNAVTTNVITAIVDEMFEDITLDKTNKAIEMKYNRNKILDGMDGDNDD